MNWENHLDKWINPNMGDVPLEAVNNLALKNLVTVMCDGGLSAKSIGNYVQVVKMVVPTKKCVRVEPVELARKER
jgi:hypothetical protein